MQTRPLRIALYSHDAMGMGHMRRNHLIAQRLVNSAANASVLMIAGASEARALPMVEGVDCLTLPALRKTPTGGYGPRSLRVSLEELIRLRARVIHGALEGFEPDLLIVDKLPRGSFRELDLALEALRRRSRTRCVLGLRDVLDDPETVGREWAEMAGEEAVRDYYDAVWIYGDPTVYDPLREYGFSTAVAQKARFTGYLNSRARQCSDTARQELQFILDLPQERVVLCAVGGGQDGAQLAEAFAGAELPRDTAGVLLAGPFMPAATRERLARQGKERPHLHVLDYASEPTALLGRAEHVIAMGGYNTVCEVLSFEKPSLIAPRTTPRREQLIRAERLRQLGALDLVLPESLTPRALSEWLERRVPAPAGIRDELDFNGLDRIPDLARELVATS